jgi:hypothetical protein
MSTPDDPADENNTASGADPNEDSTQRKSSGGVVCAVCKRRMQEVTAAHLRAEGWTLSRYRRAFPAAPTRTTPTRARRLRTSAPQAADTGSPTRASDPVGGIPAERYTNLDALAIARRIIEDPEVIRSLADEVSETIFSSSLRERLRFALVGTIARLEEVRTELTQEWRVTQGGPNGGPTPTKDLVAIHASLAQEVAKGEELVLKAVKLAIDETKGREAAHAQDGLLDVGRFSGTAGRLPVPAELSSSERETIRTLMDMMRRAVEAKRALTIPAVVTNTTLTSGPSQTPGSTSPQISAPHVGSSAPVEDPLVKSVEDEAADI